MPSHKHTHTESDNIISPNWTLIVCLPSCPFNVSGQCVQLREKKKKKSTEGKGTEVFTIEKKRMMTFNFFSGSGIEERRRIVFSDLYFPSSLLSLSFKKEDR